MIPKPKRHRENGRGIPKLVFARLTRFVALPIFLLIICGYPAMGGALDSYSVPVPDDAISPELPGDPTALNAFVPVPEKLRRTTLLPPSMVLEKQTNEADDPPDPLEIKTDVDRLMKNYDEQIPFQGLYFKTDVIQDLESSDTDIDYRLEWKLFEDGWFEMKKEFEKKRIQNELQTLQLLNDVMQHWLNQKLDGIKLLTHAVQYQQASQQSKVLAKILKRRHTQLLEGYVTRDDFDHTRFKYRQAELKMKLYAPAKDAGLPSDVYQLLNCGEYLTLSELSEKKKTAEEQAYPLKIQQNLAQRVELGGSWTDDLKVDLYVEQRNRFGKETQNNVGVEMRIPLYWNSRRSSIVEREKKLYEKQEAVLRQRIETNIEKLYASFNYQQYWIKSLLLELEKTAQRKRYEQERTRRMLEDLDHTPERSLDMILLEEVDSRYEVVGARLKLYEILVKLMALTHATHLRDLIAGTQIDCQDR